MHAKCLRLASMRVPIPEAPRLGLFSHRIKKKAKAEGKDCSEYARRTGKSGWTMPENLVRKMVPSSNGIVHLQVIGGQFATATAGDGVKWAFYLLEFHV
jgi:hypothetical protein